MRANPSAARRQFIVEIIKPSHYDDDGYVIQWWRAFIPSNSLACLSALAEDAKSRQALGENVDIVVNAYDECLMFIPTREIIKRIQEAGGRGVVLLAGVQSNQFPRAADLAREFRGAGIQVVVGGFHVSGCISMLPELPPEIKAVQDMGVSLFAGEAESKLDALLEDAWNGKLQPVYNHLLDLPGLEGEVTPLLPPGILRRSCNFAAFDVGRGCPFRCSFCTIINVQGRKSRYRDADDVERIVRANATKGVNRFFITDDNMARNKNWESIFDRLIHLRENEGFRLKLLVQVDTMCHKIPRFIEKAARAGCNRVFIGMESVNPENLIAAKKFQNKISEYRAMLQAWRAQGVMTHAGYILGFPADTPASIERDIRLIQRELPIDILEFFILTPLPGSADHKELFLQGVAMDSDMNSYDTEHVTTGHRQMTADEWRAIYNRAWHLYYSPEHIETILKRTVASGGGAQRMLDAIMLYYGSFRFEHLHPLQCGLFRRKVRTTRRPSFPVENPLVFHARRAWEIISKSAREGLFYLGLHRIRRRVINDPLAKQYTDQALAPVNPAELAEPEACTGHDHSHDHSHAPAVVPLTNLAVSPAADEEHDNERAA